MNHIPILIATSASLLLPAIAGHPAKMDSRLAACPEDVRQTIIAEARGGEVDELEIVQGEGRTIYLAEVELPADLKIYVEENGRIDDVEKQTSSRKVVYLVEFEKTGGVEVNLKISPDGNVMSRREEHGG